MGLIDDKGRAIDSKGKLLNQTQTDVKDVSPSAQLRRIVASLPENMKSQASELTGIADVVQQTEEAARKLQSKNQQLKAEVQSVRTSGNDGAASMISDLQAKQAIDRERFAERLLAVAAMHGIPVNREMAVSLANVD